MANWSNLDPSGNVIDRRGMRAGGLGLFGIVAVLGISMFLGADPLAVLNQLDTSGALAPAGTTDDAQQFAGEDAYETFSKRVMGSIDAYWRRQVDGYEPAALVLFRDRTTSACGSAVSMVGPHYCPLDEHIYLDERFFEELESSLGARGGDVAQAYVIAHEAGHHVQNLVGAMSDGRSAKMSVKTELSADCLAGAWLGSLQSQNVYEQDEIVEAIDAASAVGDDNIQERTEGEVRPESWTHGSSEQRKASLLRGYTNFQDPSVCIEGLV